MNIHLRILVLFLACFPHYGWSQGVSLGTLRVVIEGVENANGQVKVGLEKSAEDFDQGSLHEARYRGETMASQVGHIEFQFKDLPYGVYAIKSFHDKDGNGRLNTNFMGIPTEDYGFSNNVRGSMGPAKFQDARFEFNSREMTIRIQLK